MVPRAASPFRWAITMAIAALAVHQLRYLIAFGEHSGEALAGSGHGYLGPSVLAVGVLAAVAAGLGLRRLARAWSGAEDRIAPGVHGLVVWLAVSTSLVGIYFAQELLEGLLSAGHPGGLHGAFGHGGAAVLPLAFAVGAIVALAVSGGRALLARLARRPARPAMPRHVRLPRPASALLPRRSPLAAAAAGRAPPRAAPARR